MYIPKSLYIKNFLSHKETYYEWEENKPILIIGRNLTDGGQSANGSGKSTFNEAITVAIKGDPLRDVKIKDLIFDGEEQSTIIWKLLNSNTLEELAITRNIYIKKASDCKVTLGSKDIILSSVGEYKKWILDEFGFSEEDFFNFFLLTLENQYRPFFSLTDTPKKAIINRFSGANRVDDVFPVLDQDLSVKKQELLGVQQSIDRLDGKKGALVEILNDLKNQNLSELKDQKIDLIKDKIEEIEAECEGKNYQIEQTEIAINLQEQEKLQLEQIKPDTKKQEELTTQIQTVKDSLTALELKQKEIEAEKEQSRKDILQKEKELDVKTRESLTEIDQLDKEIEQKKAEYSAGELRIKKQKAALESQMAESITCPSCAHIFSLKDDTFDAVKVAHEIKHLETRLTAAQKVFKEQEKTQQELAEVRSEVRAEQSEAQKEIAILIQQLNAKFESKLKASKDSIDEANNQIKTINSTLRELYEQESAHLNKISAINSKLNLTKSNLALYQKQFKDLIEEIASKNADITRIKSEPLEDNSVKEKELQNQIAELDKQYSVYTDSYEKIEAQIVKINVWINHFKSFKSHLANKSIKNIEDHTNLFLQEMKTDLSVEIEGFRMLSTGKLKEEISTSILRNGLQKKPYGRFSRGERARIDLASILAMNELVNVNAKNGLSMIIIDEILDSCDSTGISNLMEGLLRLDKTVMLISQNEAKDFKNNTLIFEKENGETKIILPTN